MPKTNKSRNRRRHATKGDGRGDAEDDDHENNPAPSMATAELDRDSEKDGRSGPVDGSAKQSSEDPNRKRKRLKKKKKKQKKNSSTDFTHCTTDPVLNEAATEVSAPMEQKSTISFPFPTDPDDHCESPIYAYEHVVPILKLLCDKSKSILIYDPYFCDGGVARNLNQLGFPQVHNRKEDCYMVWKQDQLPPFDVLVTNPPYSCDHMERLMKFIISESFDNRPWLLLLPNWVHKKDYYVEATKEIRPFYIVPRKRYIYEPPKDFREAKKSDVHKKSSPFVSMWYVWGGTEIMNERLIRHFLQVGNQSECDLARSKSALRDLRRKKR